MRRLPTAFAVLTFPRSGSEWLNETLDSHPQIVTYGELFLAGGADANPDPLHFDEYLASVPEWARRAQVLHRFAYLGKLYGHRSRARAVGFKLTYKQARANAGVLHFFALRRVRVVHLIRANLLDAVISYEVAKKAGSFHPRGADELPRSPVSLDASRLRVRLEHMEWASARARSWLERFRLPRIEIAYEELLGRREESLARILDFLGVEPYADSLDSSLVRVIRGPSLDLVENRDEVRTSLVGTRFEWMLRMT